MRANFEEGKDNTEIGMRAKCCRLMDVLSFECGHVLILKNEIFHEILDKTTSKRSDSKKRII